MPISSYTGSRPDIRALIPDQATRVLDVGYSTGALGRALKEERPALTVYGIELDAQSAAIAAQRLDQVFQGDVDAFEWSRLDGLAFDCIIFGDVLEHLEDPWAVLRKAAGYLRPNGCVVVSLPNIRHVSSLYWIYVRGVWPVRERGIHDRSHRHFFTLHNIHELLAAAGCTAVQISRQYRVSERPSRVNELLFATLYGTKLMNRVPVVRELFTYQYVVMATVQQHESA